jgi:iron(III) transport system substrate-binding protein
MILIIVNLTRLARRAHLRGRLAIQAAAQPGESPMLLPRRTLAALATLGLSSFAARAQAPAAAPGADGIVVYNAQHVSLTQAWAAGFTQDTGIKVTLRNGGDVELGNQIVQEGAASPADVFLTENSPAMALVQSAGLFAALDPATLAQVPENFRPAAGRWIGIAARSTVFAYDTRKLSGAQLPRSIMDLADPAWKGRWAASPTGADFQAIVSAMLQLKGEATTLAWLKAMKTNFTAYRGNSTVMKAVNAGQIEGGVIYHYYFFGDRAKTGENSNNVALHYFRGQDPGAFVSLSGGGVLGTSKHPAEAQAFLRWITGPKGQEILRSGDSFEYAAGAGAASNPALVPLAQLQAPAVEPSTLNSKAVVELMTQAGLL